MNFVCCSIIWGSLVSSEAGRSAPDQVSPSELQDRTNEIRATSRGGGSRKRQTRSHQFAKGERRNLLDRARARLELSTLLRRRQSTRTKSRVSRVQRGSGIPFRGIDARSNNEKTRADSDVRSNDDDTTGAPNA